MLNGNFTRPSANPNDLSHGLDTQVRSGTNRPFKRRRSHALSSVQAVRPRRFVRQTLKPISRPFSARDGASLRPRFCTDVCTNADLSGAYVYSVNATSLPVPPVGPLAILGKITLDGKGNFAGKIQGSIAGEILPEVPISGTYSIAGDCTGSFVTIYPLFTAHFSLVLVDGVDRRKHAELLAIDAGTVGTGAVKPMIH